MTGRHEDRARQRQRRMSGDAALQIFMVIASAITGGSVLALIRGMSQSRIDRTRSKREDESQAIANLERVLGLLSARVELCDQERARLVELAGKVAALEGALATMRAENSLLRNQRPQMSGAA